MNSDQPTPQEGVSEPFSWILRQLLEWIQANPPRKIQVNPSAEN